MLVLSRKVHEKIQIGDNITIEIVRISGDKVRIGILAPKEVSVHRMEIYERLQREASLPVTISPGQTVKVQLPLHRLYKTGDIDTPISILDSNGEVVLGLCRVCGRGEAELSEPCIPR